MGKCVEPKCSSKSELSLSTILKSLVCLRILIFRGTWSQDKKECYCCQVTNGPNGQESVAQNHKIRNVVKILDTSGAYASKPYQTQSGNIPLPLSSRKTKLKSAKALAHITVASEQNKAC